MGEVFKLNHCYNMDCLPAMELFPDNYFDLAVVDPPYFSGPERRGFYGSKVSKIGVHRDYPVSPAWSKPEPEYFRELLRVCRRYIVWGCNYFDYQFATGRIVWDKCNGNSSFSDCEIAATNLFSSVRMFRYMWSGMMQGKSITEGDTMQGNKSLNEKRIHPTQKPVALYDWIFKNYAEPGQKILDTHLGSGSSRIAAYEAGLTPLVAVPGQVTSYGIGNGQAHAYASKEKSGTLDTMHDAQAVAIEYSGCLNPWDTQARRVYGEDGAFPALPSRETAGGNQQAVLAGQRTRWIVRRLTPTECERLQGYPDGWTDIGEWTDTKGKKHKPADSPRYKALGNSIALPQWFWIARKMKSYMGDGAKLGSLFDGIGGFPLVWETTYGTGTARWASEIEEFPIAVTKKHFPERKEYEN